MEAIRQAVLADQARIAYERPALPSHRLVELRIDSTLTGPDFRLLLNDGFNAVIGGRGSGKSAVLEYLRFGLGRSAGDIVSGEEDYRERDQQLINETLQTGAVSIEQGDRMGTVMTAALFGELTHQQLNGVFAKIDDATMGRLLTATAEDYISFEYRDARRFIPFGQASPGQQAAALLQLLLSQEAGTLIIDQPEDDLDNRVIMDICKLLQKTKRRRQLVFATHNPNFVVNGDADKIIAMLPGGHEAAQAAPQPPRIIEMRRIGTDRRNHVEFARPRSARHRHSESAIKTARPSHPGW